MELRLQRKAANQSQKDFEGATKVTDQFKTQLQTNANFYYCNLKAQST